MAVETPNVVQCCLSTDVSKLVMLRQVQKGLDACFKGLSEYLDAKRKIYPRFNFVPDEILLAILSKPHSTRSVVPFLRYGIRNGEVYGALMVLCPVYRPFTENINGLKWWMLLFI